MSPQQLFRYVNMRPEPEKIHTTVPGRGSSFLWRLNKFPRDQYFGIGLPAFRF